MAIPARTLPVASLALLVGIGGTLLLGHRDTSPDAVRTVPALPAAASAGAGSWTDPAPRGQPRPAPRLVFTPDAEGAKPSRERAPGNGVEGTKGVDVADAQPPAPDATPGAKAAGPRKHGDSVRKRSARRVARTYPRRERGMPYATAYADPYAGMDPRMVGGYRDGPYDAPGDGRGWRTVSERQPAVEGRGGRDGLMRWLGGPY